MVRLPCEGHGDDGFPLPNWRQCRRSGAEWQRTPPPAGYSCRDWRRGAHRSSQLPRPSHPVDALLEKYAQDILDTEPRSASASDGEFRAWRAHVRERVGTAIGEIRREDEPDRERIWGRDATIEARCRSNKRPR